MAKSQISKRVETWTVHRKGTPVTITKIAVRHSDGRFHGATNYRDGK